MFRGNFSFFVHYFKRKVLSLQSQSEKITTMIELRNLGEG